MSNPKFESKKAGLWAQLMAAYRNIHLFYSTYTREDHAKENGEVGLDETIRQVLDQDRNLTVLDFHYPEKDLLNPNTYSRYSAMFGSNVRQFIHLHCMPELLLRYKGGGLTEDERIKVLTNLAESGDVKKYLAVSSDVRDAFVEKGLKSDHIEIVPNGINPDIYQFRSEPDRMAFRSQADITGKYLIGYSGRLDMVKGYDNLIAIMSWFDKHPEFDIGFVIASTHGRFTRTVHDDLMTRTPRLLQEKRVGFVIDVAKLVGNTKSRNSFVDAYFSDYMQQKLSGINPLYQGLTTVPVQALADLYIQPSNSEGFGLAALEALAVGTPVVANRVGGLREFIPDQIMGRLVDYHPKGSRRNKDFCDAMVSVLFDTFGSCGERDSTAYRQSTRNKILNKYSSQAMVTKTDNVYRLQV
ncbi:glycosyltransferase family 4 protein [Candidatus Woesearchaeota archaeon]|nr:glycosyltransferase family 4 protein [Candidatus Woesearchaeota archaeon]